MSVEPRSKDFTVTVRDENLPRTEIVEVLLKLSAAKLTAGDLIAERVRAECQDIKGKWISNLVKPTADEIALNGEATTRKFPANPEAKVADALASFESNGFVLLVDDEQIEELDQEITMTPTSVVTFVKLTPLVGG